MESILEQLTDWIREMLVSGIMGNLSGMFESVNRQVGEIAMEVGRTPANFSPGVFAMIRNVSESVIVPVAGIILTIIACYELIQLVEHNNLANFDTWIIFKWIFKTFVAVMVITNCFNIVMAVFDVTQQVVNAGGSIIAGSTAVDASTLLAMEADLLTWDLGPLLGLYLQSFVVQVTMLALSAVIFVIVYGRMIEIYLMTSLAPIPLSTFGRAGSRSSIASVPRTWTLCLMLKQARTLTEGPFLVANTGLSIRLLTGCRCGNEPRCPAVRTSFLT